ncbi:penicillin-binding protein 2 [cyanobiont of Ornithocercus magnificus]|nr:penicillin-binding protein 2 [cyanobiont of Ornithocercus magnificus]
MSVLKSGRAYKNRSKPIALQAVPIHRMKLVVAVLCSGLVGLVGRMSWLQLVQAPILESYARNLQSYKNKPLGTRRPIVDRNGQLVALDEIRFRIWAHPRYFHFLGDNPGITRKPLEVAGRLSTLLATPTSELVRRLGNYDSGVRLADGISPEIAIQLQRLNISGLDLEAYPERIYPQGSLFASVIGFLNQERIPQAGLEQSRHSDLRRYEQIWTLRRGADGTPLPNDLIPGVFYGDGLQLHLTLDSRLQRLARKALSRQVIRWKANRGMALVMDVRNGELLALTSTPTYDPNRYWNSSPAYFREWSVQDLYEPGSTFKPINLAIALQEGVIKPGEYVYDSGELSIGGWSIRNHDRRGNGPISFPTILQVSSNVAMVRTMRKLSPELYWSWLDRLGIATRLNTDLPGAVAGQLKTREEFTRRSIEAATAAFGQGFSITPLKLAQLHALIANGGRLVSPHITRGLSAAGKAMASPEKTSGPQLLRPEVTRTILKWMETVVENGSGYGVQTPGYRISGKTGTAQKAHGGAYSDGVKICSFVATLPTEDPRYVVLVVVDEPKGDDAYGATVAVPVAKRIIDTLLVIERIQPSVAIAVNEINPVES